MALDTHGLSMVGLRDACHCTKYCNRNNGLVAQITYNCNTGHVWANVDTTNTWIVYDDPAIVTVGYARSPVTMQQIADAVYMRMCGYVATQTIQAT